MSKIQDAIKEKVNARRELTMDELEQVSGGKKPKAGAAVWDFFMWVACGFSHNYIPTGKTRKEIDLVFPVDFYEVKCTECGNVTWKRGQPVQGPKIKENP